jgi:hypothetical protein
MNLHLAVIDEMEIGMVGLSFGNYTHAIDGIQRALKILADISCVTETERDPVSVARAVGTPIAR